MSTGCDFALRFLSLHNVCISGSGQRRLNPTPWACCKSSSPICSLGQLIVSPTPRRPHKGATSARLLAASGDNATATKRQSTALLLFSILRAASRYNARPADRRPDAGHDGSDDGRTCRHLTSPAFPRSQPSITQLLQKRFIATNSVNNQDVG